MEEYKALFSIVLLIRQVNLINRGNANNLK